MKIKCNFSLSASFLFAFLSGFAPFRAANLHLPLHCFTICSYLTPLKSRLLYLLKLLVTVIYVVTISAVVTDSVLGTVFATVTK